MKKILWCVALVILGLGMSCQVGATTIQSLFGDMDGFGLGYVDGQEFKANQDFQEAVRACHETTDGITDAFSSGNHGDGIAWKEWSQPLGNMLPVPFSQTSLEVVTGGQGLFGASTLYLVDGDSHKIKIGNLTDGDTGESSFVRRDVFDLMPFWDTIYAGFLKTGKLDFRIETIADQNGGQFAYDGWIMDYSRLTISDAVPIPEPELPLLLVCGFGFLVLLAKMKTGSGVLGVRREDGGKTC